MRIKNTHWTYCTHFSQSYENNTSRCPAPPWAHWKIIKRKKRQQGTLLSCQLTINGSAPQPSPSPPLTAHTSSYCSDAGHCWADIVCTFPSFFFACNLALMANLTQNIRSAFLHIPHDSICSDFPCLQQTPQRVSCVNWQKKLIN